MKEWISIFINWFKAGQILTHSKSTKNGLSFIKHQKKSDLPEDEGEFIRGTSKFRYIMGETSKFPAEPYRYHLFVAYNCPWCHRVTLARNILGLSDSLTMDIAFPNRTSDDDMAGAGLWEFSPERVATLTGGPLSECTKDTGTGKNYRLVKQIYEAEGSDETSVPILFDKRNQRIVSNESSEIVRMLNRESSRLGSSFSDQIRIDIYPDLDNKKNLRAEIDELNELIYFNINDGAYKAGFSSNQDVYATAFFNYFDTLLILEKRLASDNRPFLTGNTFTEADLRLFPTLFRHDPVYYVRMKLNGARVLDFPFLWRWLCRVYALPGVAASNSLIHCQQGYFGRSWNNVVPLGPTIPMKYPEAYRHPELAGKLV